MTHENIEAVAVHFGAILGHLLRGISSWSLLSKVTLCGRGAFDLQTQRGVRTVRVCHGNAYLRDVWVQDSHVLRRGVVEVLATREIIAELLCGIDGELSDVTGAFIGVAADDEPIDPQQMQTCNRR